MKFLIDIVPSERYEFLAERGTSQNLKCRTKMPLSLRMSNVYWYESKRVKGKVVNKLVAKGEAARREEARACLLAQLRATQLAIRLADEHVHRERRVAFKAWRSEMQAEERPMIEASRLARDLAEGWLSALGFRKRRGQWRRPRGVVMPRSMFELARDLVSAEPRAPEVKVCPKTQKIIIVPPDDDTDPDSLVVKHLFRAFNREASEAPLVRKACDAYEAEVAASSSSGVSLASALDTMIGASGGDPIALAEQALIRRAAASAGEGLYAEEVLRRRLLAYKAGLLGVDPTAIERSIVEVIGLAWLEVAALELKAATADEEDWERQEYLDRRRERAGKRLLSGLRSLDLIRRKAIPATSVLVQIGRDREMALGREVEGLAGPERVVMGLEEGKPVSQDGSV